MDLIERSGSESARLRLPIEQRLGSRSDGTGSPARSNVQLVTRDAGEPEDSVISVHTNDVDGAYEEAQRLGYEIVQPITTEPWGVRRFFVRAPDGNVINVVRYRE